MTETVTEIKKKKHYFNPFPGLRPFSIKESHLFFGREGQSYEVLDKLNENRFVAVIGASGSGKSSLMYCGLIPVLHGGFISEAGNKWRIVVTRPGNGPVANLAEAIVHSEANPSLNGEFETRKSIHELTLRSSSLGLIESVKSMKKDKDENILIMVDQFEELFRFKNRSGIANAINESYAFVKLLLEAVSQQEVPIYIILTMRSDFIGECAQYQELTEMINVSHYLIPQMTRENMRSAIEGPVAVGGGIISDRLVNQLLNDVGDNPDQLPILQHALMRTWDYWIQHKKGEESMDVVHYEAIGRMEKALSEHANEAYDELSPNGKKICENVFKSLTERGGDNRGIRRPTPVAELCDVSKASLADIEEVVDAFKKPGRSFLAVSKDEMAMDTIIDISHESLMRIWERLKIWVEEEAIAVQMYMRLTEASQLYQEGKSGLWRPPDLHLALNWKKEKQPILTWAKRYAPAFERTMNYLEISEKEYLAEEENKIRLQKRALRRSRITAIILGSAAIVSLGFMVYAFMMQAEAKKQKIQAEEQRIEAEQQKIIAEKKQSEADEQRKLADEQKILAEKQRAIADQQRVNAERSAEEARRQKEIATQKSEEATQQRELAEKKSVEALDQKQRAESAREASTRLRFLSIAKSMAVKSVQENTNFDLKALLAYQAFLYNEKYGGVKYDPDIYNGLYYSLKELSQKDFNSYKGHGDVVRSMVFNPQQNTLYSTGSDGNVFSWDMNEVNKWHKTLLNNNFVNRTLAISNDAKWLACGTEMASLELINMNDVSNQFSLIGHRKAITKVVFSPDNQYVYSSGLDSLILKWDLATRSKKIFAQTLSKIKTISISSDGRFLAVVLQNGRLLLYNTETGVSNELTMESMNIHVAEFSRDGSMLVTGNTSGILHFWDINTRKLLVSQSAHKARISDIQFSPDNKIIASASFDGIIKLWQTDNLNAAPVQFNDHDSWVWSIIFNNEGNVLYAGCVDGQIKKWFIASSMVGENLQPKITRNMTENEWKAFVGEDIPYEKTVNNLP